MADAIAIIRKVLFALASLALTKPSKLPDYVAGKLIVFNDNGAWSWYQDERVIVDPVAGTLLVGSVASKSGTDGATRNGNVELVAYSWPDGGPHLVTLHHNLQSDDHNVPALLIRPDGRYIAAYAGHNLDCLTRWRVSVNPHDASQWTDEQTFDWSQPQVSIANNKVTYSNLFYLSAERRTYNFVRAVNRDPSFLVSSDNGSSWSYGGQLLSDVNVGYVNGYVKYASKGTDRIHFVTTEHHPRDFNNSIFHGYISRGETHRSSGVAIASAPRPADLTQVFAAGTDVNGEFMTHCWTTDLVTDSVGGLYCIFTCRANDVPENSNFDDHRFFYARFDGAHWHVYQLAKGGARLWSSEEDYIGGAAIDPQDCNIVYISTPIDPRDEGKLDKHEIFKGITSDGGANWTWRPITLNSRVDNLRPIVPQWTSGHTALLWCRGTMYTSQSYNMQIVGIIERASCAAKA
jgi:hypothetical protein